jgi:hypothetical protein
LPCKPGCGKITLEFDKPIIMTDKNPEKIQNKIPDKISSNNIPADILSDEQRKQLTRERELIERVKKSLINSSKKNNTGTDDIEFLLKRL